MIFGRSDNFKRRYGSWPDEENTRNVTLTSSVTDLRKSRRATVGGLVEISVACYKIIHIILTKELYMSKVCFTFIIIFR